VAGIYIHIPFCRKKCHYCNFFSLATKKYRQEFVEALLTEIDLTRDYLRNDPVETIYIGGGTPSLLDTVDLQKIIEKLQRLESGSQGAGLRPQVSDPISPITPHASPFTEITLELNPEDVTPEYLELLSQTPVNRLSLGLQSFYDEDLVYLGRNHTAAQGKEALKHILAFPFHSSNTLTQFLSPITPGKTNDSPPSGLRPRITHHASLITHH